MLASEQKKGEIGNLKYSSPVTTGITQVLNNSALLAGQKQILFSEFSVCLDMTSPSKKIKHTE